MSDPSTISRFIVAVDINPVNFGFGEISLSHIGDKGCGVMPSFADSNSSCSIAIKARRFGGVTTMHHGYPFSVNGVFVKAVPRDLFFLETSATGDACFKLIQSDYSGGSSAVALTDSSISVSAFGLPDSKNDKLPESFANMYRIGREWDKSEVCKIH